MDADTTWHPVSDLFFSHPKVRTAGRDGALLFLAALGYCGRHLTDGAVPKNALDIIAAEGFTTKKAAGSLVRVRLWHDMGEHFQVNDWHGWNRTREQAEERRAKRAGAGALGNHRRWHVDRGIVDPDCGLCRPNGHDPPPDPDGHPTGDRKCDPNGSRPAIANGSQSIAETETETETDPSSSSAVTATGAAEGWDDDDHRPAGPVLAALAAELGARDQRRRLAVTHLDPVADPDRHLERCVERWLRPPRRARLEALIVEHPDWTPDRLAALAEAPADVAPGALRPWEPPSFADCPRCHGRGVYELPDGDLARCDHQPAARPELRVVREGGAA